MEIFKDFHTYIINRQQKNVSFPFFRKGRKKKKKSRGQKRSYYFVCFNVFFSLYFKTIRDPKVHFSKLPWEPNSFHINWNESFRFIFFHEKNTLRKSNYVFMIFTMRNDSNDKETHDCYAITEVRIFYLIQYKRLSRKNMDHAVVLKISITFSKPLTSVTHFHFYSNFLVVVFFFFPGIRM